MPKRCMLNFFNNGVSCVYPNGWKWPQQQAFMNRTNIRVQNLVFSWFCCYCPSKWFMGYADRLISKHHLPNLREEQWESVFDRFLELGQLPPLQALWRIRPSSCSLTNQEQRIHGFWEFFVQAMQESDTRRKELIGSLRTSLEKFGSLPLTEGIPLIVVSHLIDSLKENQDTQALYSLLEDENTLSAMRREVGKESEIIEFLVGKKEEEERGNTQVSFDSDRLRKAFIKYADKILKGVKPTLQQEESVFDLASRLAEFSVLRQLWADGLLGRLDNQSPRIGRFWESFVMELQKSEVSHQELMHELIVLVSVSMCSGMRYTKGIPQTVVSQLIDSASKRQGPDLPGVFYRMLEKNKDILDAMGEENEFKSLKILAESDDGRPWGKIGDVDSKLLTKHWGRLFEEAIQENSTMSFFCFLKLCCAQPTTGSVHRTLYNTDPRVVKFWNRCAQEAERTKSDDCFFEAVCCGGNPYFGSDSISSAIGDATKKKISDAYEKKRRSHYR